MQISSHGQKAYEGNVPPPQIGLWQQYRLNKPFLSVQHGEVLASGQVWATTNVIMVCLVLPKTN